MGIMKGHYPREQRNSTYLSRQSPGPVLVFWHCWALLFPLLCSTTGYLGPVPSMLDYVTVGLRCIPISGAVLFCGMKSKYPGLYWASVSPSVSSPAARDQAKAVPCSPLAISGGVTLFLWSLTGKCSFSCPLVPKHSGHGVL